MAGEKCGHHVLGDRLLVPKTVADGGGRRQGCEIHGVVAGPGTWNSRRCSGCGGGLLLSHPDDDIRRRRSFVRRRPVVWQDDDDCGEVQQFEKSLNEPAFSPASTISIECPSIGMHIQSFKTAVEKRGVDRAPAGVKHAVDEIDQFVDAATAASRCRLATASRTARWQSIVA